MKKFIPVVLICALLAACVPGQDATPSDADMATRVAQILTSMPPSENVLPEVTATLPAVPTVVEITMPPPTATEALATETPTEMPTETPLPVTETPAESPTPDGTLTNTPVPSFTAPATDPRLRLGNPTSTDPMDNADTWGWPLGPSEYTSMDFRDGAMVLAGLTSVSGWRLPITEAFTNQYIEMTVRTGTCTGNDNYGIMLRVPVFREADQGYLFGVSCDGKFNLRKWDGKVLPNGRATTLISWKANPAIVPGANQTNRLGVMVVDSRLIVYANGVQLGEASDSSYPSGYFGVFVDPDQTQNFTVYIDEMSYWTNPTP
ncbi:MAG: hypothetical protein GYA17_20910 [Chloroflexi bacterium]|nr:hypothetical protein [Chloroflexota bacterium]